MKRFFTARGKNGAWLVLFILAVGVMGSGLTIWNYSKHVFSSRDAQVLNHEGAIAAFFPQRFVKKIFPHQIARITFQDQAFRLPCKAEVVSVSPTMLGRGHVLLVTLQLLAPETEDEKISWKDDETLNPGLGCSVTIDTTIPPK